MPPVLPMLAKSVAGVPEPDDVPGGFVYEPKWDGFRAIVYRDGDEVRLDSRNSRPMERYFPEVVDAVAANTSNGSVAVGPAVPGPFWWCPGAPGPDEMWEAGCNETGQCQ